MIVLILHSMFLSDDPVEERNFVLWCFSAWQRLGYDHAQLWSPDHITQAHKTEGFLFLRKDKMRLVHKCVCHIGLWLTCGCKQLMGTN